MGTRFLIHLRSCLYSRQCQRLACSPPDEAPGPTVAADLATIIADYVLVRLAEAPASCTTGCALDFVADEEILRAAEVSPETLAAAFAGGIAQLERWLGEPGVSFMVENGVPSDDAWDVSRAVAVICQKLNSRCLRLRAERADHSALYERA